MLATTVLAGLMSNFAAAGVGQHIYFTDGTPHTIRRANLDGSSTENLVDTSPLDAISIAVDSLRREIHWSLDNWRIYRTSIDAPSTATSFSTIAPTGVAVDIVGGWIYWGFGFDFPNGIARGNLDGTDQNEIYTSTNNSAPKDVALDWLAEKMYWTEGSRVIRSNLDGTSVQAVVEVTGANEPFPYGVAVDPVRRTLYWTTAGGGVLVGQVRRSTLDGQDASTIAELDPFAYSDIVVDSPRGMIYWTDSYAIRRARVDGSGQETIVSTTNAYAGPIAIDSIAPVPTLSSTSILILALGFFGVALGVLLKRLRCVSDRWANASTP